MYIHSLKFSCSKSYDDFPCSHRQWRHEGHCRFVHGYSRSFTFWFTAKKLDLNGFVVDFSSLKPLENRLKGTGVTPSYRSWYENDCFVSIAAGTYQEDTWSAIKWFSVNVCSESAEIMESE